MMLTSTKFKTPRSLPTMAMYRPDLAHPDNNCHSNTECVDVFVGDLKCKDMIRLGMHFFAIRHFGERRNPIESRNWTPACAGVTNKSAFPLGQCLSMPKGGKQPGQTKPFSCTLFQRPPSNPTKTWHISGFILLPSLKTG
jgi:hypothetical protein